MSIPSKDHINEVLNRDIANSASIATVQDLKKKTDVNDQTAYIIADAFSVNPTQLLGRVVEIRKKNNECPTGLTNNHELNFEFSARSIVGFNVDPETKASKPELRGSIIVDDQLCAQSGFLNFLSAQLDQKSTFSLMIMDQAKGLIIQDEKWDTALDAWIQKYPEKMSDPDICYIYVVVGFVQKNIIKKKYIQFEAGSKGGTYGINIDGKLSTSTEDYSLDIIFGLTPAIIKRPTAQVGVRDANTSLYVPSVDEKMLFAGLTGSTINMPSNISSGNP